MNKAKFSRADMVLVFSVGVLVLSFQNCSGNFVGIGSQVTALSSQDGMNQPAAPSSPANPATDSSPAPSNGSAAVTSPTATPAPIILPAPAFANLISCSQTATTQSCGFQKMPNINQNTVYDPQGRQSVMCMPTAWAAVIEMMMANGYTFGSYAGQFATASLIPYNLANDMGTSLANKGTFDVEVVNGIVRRGLAPIATAIGAEIVQRKGSFVQDGLYGTQRITPASLRNHVNSAHPGSLEFGFYTPTTAVLMSGGSIASFTRTDGHIVAISGQTTNLDLFNSGNLVSSFSFQMMDPDQLVTAFRMELIATAVPAAAKSTINMTLPTLAGVSTTVNEANGYCLITDGTITSSASEIYIAETYSHWE